MPSGKTHDIFTVLLIAPVSLLVFSLTGALFTSAIVTGTFLFGGLMFGPDLDTLSKQYTRWGIFRFLWFPYQKFFSHRSRWSHGFLFGTLFRVIYFLGVLTLVAFLVGFVATIYSGGEIPNVLEYARSWTQIGVYLRTTFGKYFLYYAFAGFWLGAASHSIGDLVMTFIKTGKSGKII